MRNDIFDSRNKEYKTPYGAVKTGTAVGLTVKPPRSLGLSRAVLCAEFEADGRMLELPMEWRALEGGRDAYHIDLETKGYTGLVWYWFRFDCRDGSLYLGNQGLMEELPPAFQLTVYKSSGGKASWFGRGVTYQIFPDRFYRLDIPGEMTGGREVHKNWDEPPLYGPKACDSGRELWNYDFFGGSLKGITAKLDYLKSMGVETLYLNPIFEAFSNHRYDTGDYEKIDPLLGGAEDFGELCRETHERGMRVVLDGVFSHTGADSKYFDREGTYGGGGAFQSKESPYFSWFDFKKWPEEYAAWWGVKTLPEVNETEPSYTDYIIEDDDSIVKRWLRHGADGWRLDVADELPDEFIHKLNSAAKRAKEDAVIIGEVWEDASNKVSYGVRRRHLLGGYLDGVMNYPFRNAVIDYAGGGDAAGFREAMETLRENYPKDAFYNCMNFLGNHDTPRVMTVLGAEGGAVSPDMGAAHIMTDVEYARGEKRLKIASLIMFAFPGSPTVYYGDEAGMEGQSDPFNRRTYPWGREDAELLQWYKRLADIRNSSRALREGGIEYLRAEGGILAFSRRFRGERVIAAANAGDRDQELNLPWSGKKAYDLMGGGSIPVQEGTLCLTLAASSAVMIAAKLL